MFQLETPTAARLQTVNLRTEKHGKEDVLAVDLGLALTLPSGALSMFGEQLLDLFYLPPSSEQPLLDGVEAVRSVLRCPDLLALPVKLSSRLDGRNVVIEHGGIGDPDGIELGTCKVNDFKIEPLPGGSVKLSLRVQSNELEHEVAGELAGLLARDVRIMITHSEATEERRTDTDPASLAAKDATDLFVAGARDGDERPDDSDDARSGQASGDEGGAP